MTTATPSQKKTSCNMTFVTSFDIYHAFFVYQVSFPPKKKVSSLMIPADGGGDWFRGGRFGVEVMAPLATKKCS